MKRCGLCGLMAGLFLFIQTGMVQAQNSTFGLGDVENMARELAAKPFVDNIGQVPDILKTISYDDWRDIRFAQEKSLWREDKLPFELQFFHPGLFYDRTVAINVVDQGVPKRLAFDTSAFNYGRNKFAEQLSADMGYAGFRIHSAINKKKLPGRIPCLPRRQLFPGRGQGASLRPVCQGSGHRHGRAHG